MFVARTVYGLPYRSQHESPIDRSHARQRRLYAKLGGKYALFEDPVPCRPKGMHHNTYARLAGAIYAAIEHHDDIWLAGTARFLARSEKAGKSRRKGVYRLHGAMIHFRQPPAGRVPANLA